MNQPTKFPATLGTRVEKICQHGPCRNISTHPGQNRKFGFRPNVYFTGAENSKKFLCGQGPQAIKHMLSSFPEVWWTQIEHVGRQVGDESDEASACLGVSKVSSRIPHTHELTQFWRAKQAFPEHSSNDSGVTTGYRFFFKLQIGFTHLGGRRVRAEIMDFSKWP